MQEVRSTRCGTKLTSWVTSMWTTSGRNGRKLPLKINMALTRKISTDFPLISSANPAQKCTHTRYLGAAPWTFTRVLSKRTLDYIFKATALASDVPGDLNCKVIHPELESVGGSHLINDHSSNQAYSFIGSWKELSDHYPVFMKFDHPTEPAGNEAAKRIALGVNQLWP